MVNKNFPCFALNKREKLLNLIKKIYDLSVKSGCKKCHICMRHHLSHLSIYLFVSFSISKNWLLPSSSLNSIKLTVFTWIHQKTDWKVVWTWFNYLDSKRFPGMPNNRCVAFQKLASEKFAIWRSIFAMREREYRIFN